MTVSNIAFILLQSFRAFWRVLDRLGQFWIVYDCFGAFGRVLERLRGFWSICKYFERSEVFWSVYEGYVAFGRALERFIYFFLKHLEALVYLSVPFWTLERYFY